MLKYFTLLCFFYIGLAGSCKEYWKMIQNVRFYNSYSEFGYGNSVDENMIYSCCSVLSNACQFVYDWHYDVAKHSIKKILYFLILFEIK